MIFDPTIYGLDYTPEEDSEYQEEEHEREYDIDQEWEKEQFKEK